MSADLNTFIEIEGTKKEVKAIIKVIKEYCRNNMETQLENTRIGKKRKFDGKNDVELNVLTQKEIDIFLTECKKKVYIEANGPYGRYGRLDEARVFEAIAEAAPKAKYKARTEGFMTGQRDILVGELKKGMLYISYSCLPNDCFVSEEDDDPSEEWLTENSIYDPIKKEYMRDYSVEEYISSMMKKMSLEQFKSIFGLSKAEVSSEKYHDYIYECYCSYQFPKMSYVDFKFAFPDAEIVDVEFDRNVVTAIKEYGLVDYETFCHQGEEGRSEMTGNTKM